MQDLLDSLPQAERIFFVLAISMARLGPFLTMVPFLSGRRLRRLFRTSLAIGLNIFLLPWLLAAAPEEPLPFWTTVPILIKETLLGALVGVLSSLPFYAASSIGFIVDTQRGLSNSQTDDPLSGEATSPLGSLMLETLIMLFIAAGGLAMFMQGLLASYVLWPPFSFWPDWSSPALTDFFLTQIGAFLTNIVVLAFPMLLVCFLVDLGMGLMNRFASQLNVFFLAMPIKSGLVMALMVVYWGVFFRAIGTDVLRMPILWDELRSVFSSG